MESFTLQSLIDKESSLRDMMLLTYDNREVYLGLLSEYEQCIRNSFTVDPDWHLILACEIQEQLDTLDQSRNIVTIPDTGTIKQSKTDEEFDKYCCLSDILAILLE